jgi:hypothetical protein
MEVGFNRILFVFCAINYVSSKSWRGRRMSCCVQFFIVSAQIVFHQNLGAGEGWVIACSFSYCMQFFIALRTVHITSHHITSPRPYLSATQQVPT